MTRIGATVLACTAAIGALLAGADAALNGQASAGENCTPFSGYSIGYSTGSGARIVQQSIVLEDGWKLIGWLIRDSSQVVFFVPYEPYFDVNVKDVSGRVPSLYVSSAGDPTLGYSTYVRSRERDRVPTRAPAVLPKRTAVHDCFKSPLSV